MECLPKFSTFTFHNRQTVVVVFGNASQFMCCQFDSRHLLGQKFPQARYHERTHTPVLHTLHLWFIPSEVPMSADEANEPNVGWDCGEAMTRLTSW